MKKLQITSWQSIEANIQKAADDFDKLPSVEQDELRQNQDAIVQGYREGGLEGAVKALITKGK